MLKVISNEGFKGLTVHCYMLGCQDGVFMGMSWSSLVPRSESIGIGVKVGSYPKTTCMAIKLVTHSIIKQYGVSILRVWVCTRCFSVATQCILNCHSFGNVRRVSITSAHV